MPTANPAPTLAPNPFGNLARLISKSSLSSGAIEKNLENRVATMRSNARSFLPRAQATEAPAVNAVLALAARNYTANVGDQADQTPATVPNAVKINAFAGLKRNTAPIAVRPAPAPVRPNAGVQTPASPAQTPTVRAAVAAPSAPAPAQTSKRSSMFSVETEDQSDLDFGDDAQQDSQVDDTSATRSYRGTSQSLSTSAKKLSTNYSDQQNLVIECDDRLIVVDAKAGSGKTTTAVGYANHRPKERMLYMCLNKANADEAKTRFGANVTPATTHSIAWRAMKPKSERITTRWKPILLMDQMNLVNAREGMVVQRVLNDFFNSSDKDISEKHAVTVALERDLKPSEINKGVAYAALAWKRMLDPGDKLQMPHDAYLKMFALKAPRLEYDTILFDEAQDANPVTLQIINSQRHCKLLCIGDKHQSIYQFRGSVNAMELLALGATHLHLSQTWRFGPQIADLANLVLHELKGEKVKIEGMAADGVWSEDQVTTLSRTNAELFRMAALTRGEGVHWVGGVNNYRLDQVMDAYHLFARENSQIKDSIMRRKFPHWDDYVRYSNEADDSEARVLVKVVDEYEHGIPDLVDDILRNAVPSTANAVKTLTTAHKSKGLEWDNVRIADDFEFLVKTEEKLAEHPDAEIPEQDVNLFYVALTRAKKAIELNSEAITWMKNLPKHRSDREAAVCRAQGVLNAQREGLPVPRMG